MNPIYASKFYRCSNRKDKIHAALCNPINVELISQLSSYVDDEYQNLTRDPKDSDSSKSTDLDKSDNSGSSEDKETASHSSSSSSGLPSKPSSGGLSAKFDSLLGDDSSSSDETLLDEAVEEDDADVPDIDDLEEVDESTSVATEDIVPQIREVLNSDPNTCQVNRILQKNDEVWVYYNDDVNLNNVMATVIEKLNIAGLSSLEFNRLARSDNAIVFQYTQPKSVSSEETIINDN